MAVGVTAGVALIAGLVSPASADAVAAASTAQASTDVTPAATEGASRVEVAHSAVEAQVAARAQGSRVEVLSERSETSLTYAEPDGSFTSEMSSGVERVRDTGGEDGWRQIDLTLEVGDDGAVRPVSPAVDVAFHGGGTADSPLAELTAEDGSVGFEWSGETLPEPDLDGNRATYADVEPGVDPSSKRHGRGSNTISC